MKFATNTNCTFKNMKISSFIITFVTSSLLLYCIGFIKYANAYNTTSSSKVDVFSSNFRQHQYQQYQQQQRVLQQQQLRQTSTNILISMEYVPSILNTPELISTFEFVISSILEYSVIALVWNESYTTFKKVLVNVTITSQRSTIPQSQSQFLSNTIITNIVGTFTNTGTINTAAISVPTDIWRKVLVQAINDNQKILIDALVKSNSIYYSSLLTITSSVDTGTDTSITGQLSYSSISVGAIVGIDIGIILLLVIVFVVLRKNVKKNQSISNTTNTTDNTRTPTNTISNENNSLQ